MRTKKKKQRKARGSFTVEAVFLFPILVLLLAFFLQTAIRLYGESDRTARDAEQVRELDSLRIFLQGSERDGTS